MGMTRDAIADIWGARTPFVGEWPRRGDEYTTEEPDTWVQSACVLCSIGCGLDIGVKDNRIVGVRGRTSDRTNHGRLGPKGLYGWQANNSDQRLTTPLIRRNGELRPASWDEAMDLIVSRSKDELTEPARARLEAMVATNDGFELAERDLEIRGEGELLGTRQSGPFGLRFASLRGDRDLLELARREAESLAAGSGLLQDTVSAKAAAAAA